MVLIDVPEAIASVFRLGEGLGEPAWRCEKTARGVYVNIRWSSNGATKPSVKHGLRRYSILASKGANVAWRSTRRRKLRRVLPKPPDNRTSNLSATPISSSSALQICRMKNLAIGQRPIARSDQVKCPLFLFPALKNASCPWTKVPSLSTP